VVVTSLDVVGAPDAPTVTLVHAVLPALAPMQTALAQAIPGVRIRHLLDEGLSTEAERYGGVTRACIERMLTVLNLAVEARTDAVLLTCTAYSTMVPEARTRFPGTPLYAVDQVMVERAVARATRIGVLATFAAGLEQQQEMLEREAALRGRSSRSCRACTPTRWRRSAAATRRSTIESCWRRCRR